ncbi:hypothetical protein F2Q69_00007125 [Brassica cretica]|uniref:Uncharacterized protein n=1 Tax=Brassica cretica TaxID=69181 RepID=A0A8S9NMR4_BRACR|nr:hypothetical protein F2Q69_00007125 [Brassica cretica]
MGVAQRVDSTELTESPASHRCRYRRWCWSGGSGLAAEDGGDDFRRRRVYLTRSQRRNFQRRVRARSGSVRDAAGVYGFVSSRGTRWWSWMHEILNG